MPTTHGKHGSGISLYHNIDNLVGHHDNLLGGLTLEPSGRRFVVENNLLYLFARCTGLYLEAETGLAVERDGIRHHIFLQILFVPHGPLGIAYRLESGEVIYVPEGNEK